MYDKRTHIGILITSICGIISSSRSAHAKIKKEKKKDRVPVDVAPPCHVHDGGFRTRRSPAMSLISLSNHASWRKVNVGPIGFVDADVWINAEATRHDTTTVTEELVGPRPAGGNILILFAGKVPLVPNRDENVVDGRSLQIANLNLACLPFLSFHFLPYRIVFWDSVALLVAQGTTMRTITIL